MKRKHLTCVVCVLAGYWVPSVSAQQPDRSKTDLEAQLDAIAADVAESLRDPLTRRFALDRKASTFAARLCVATDWPHPSFKAPLVAMLDHQNPVLAVAAAEALRRYGDDAIMARIRAMADDERFSKGAREKLLKFAAEPSPEAGPRQAPGAGAALSLFPSVDEWAHFAPDELNFATVPEAVAALRAADPGQRIRGFLWLAGHRIVLDCSPLSSMWSSLETKQQAAALQYMLDIVWGRELLAAWLGELLKDGSVDRMERESRAWFWEVAAGLPVAGGREASLRTIEGCIAHGTPEELGDPFSEQAILLAAAFRAFGQAAGDDDLHIMLDWLRSPVGAVRGGALYALAWRDSPEAVDAVIESLCRDDEQSSSLTNAHQALLCRDWPNGSVQRRYVRTLISIVERELRKVPDTQCFNSLQVSGRSLTGPLDLVQAIMQESKGPTGGRHPAYIEDLDEIRATAARWRAWLDSQEEATSRPAR